VLSTIEFDYVRNVVNRISAIELLDDKKYLVELRLSILANSEGYPSINHLIKNLQESTDSDLQKKVVDAMTTNETFFFRDHSPFELLRKEIIPNLLLKRASEKELNIWSAACSTGQEPYSISMLLHQHFPELVKFWNLSILATDLSISCLEYARRGSYDQIQVNRGLPVPYLVRFFNNSGIHWHLIPEVKQKVLFKEMNLIEKWVDMPKMDIIFLRNVLIYFNIETRKQILENIKFLLKPDGYLFLGQSESTYGIMPDFKRVDFTNSDSCFQLI